MDQKMVSLQKVNKKKQEFFFKDYIDELPASLSQTKSNKDRIKNEFILYLDILGKDSFYPYGTRKSKKVQIDLDDSLQCLFS